MHGRNLIVLIASVSLALGGVAWAAPGSTPGEAPTKLRGFSAALEDPNLDVAVLAMVLQLSWDESSQSVDPAIEQRIRAIIHTPRFAEMLHAERDATRQIALQLLWKFGGASPELLPQILERLKDPNDSVRRAAVLALAQVAGTAQAPARLVELLRGQDLDLAHTAAEELTKLGAGVRPYASDIAQLLQRPGGPHEDVVRLLGEMEAAGRLYAPQVTQLLRDPTGSTRAAAVHALVKMGAASDERVIAVIDLLKDSSSKVRDEAVQALGAWEDVAGPHLPRLLALLSHEDVSVRHAAVQALGRMRKTARMRSSLFIARQKDPDADIRRAATKALVGMEVEAGPRSQHVVEYLQSTDPCVREAAALALSELGEEPQKYVRELLPLLKDSESQVRTEAVHALAKAGPAATEHIPRIIELLKDPDYVVRGTASKALSRMKGLTPEHVYSISVLLEEPLVGDRYPALQVLRELGPSAGAYAPRVGHLLEDPDRDVRRLAAEALGRMGDPARTEALRLVKLLRDPSNDPLDGDRSLENQVAVTLVQMGPLDVSIVMGLLDKASSDPGRSWLWLASAHLVGGGDPRVEQALRWVGRRGLRDRPREFSIEEAQQTLETFAELWELTEKYPELRADLAEQIATVARLTRGQWSTRDVMLLQRNRRLLQESQPMHAETVQAAIDSIERWRFLKDAGWSWATHAGFWVLLLFFYPRSPKVQAFFFWNPWVRNITGLGYVSLLLTWVPFLRCRLLAPFSRLLLADADLERFSADTYFSRSEVLISSTGKRERLLSVLPRLQGQVVLEGASGLGKSMFLRYLLQHSKRLAVYLPAERCKDGVIEAIQAKLEGHGKDSTFLQSIIYSGALDIYIDGLNEVTADTRARIVQFVERNFHGNILLTAQRMEWTPPTTARLLVLQPLSETETAEFLASREPTQSASSRLRGDAYRQACKDFVARALSPELPEELRRSMREVLSNPMDLTVVAQMLADGHVPELSHLRQQQYELMAKDYAEVHLAEFPLKEFAEEAYRMRREDRTIVSEQLFDRELQRMEAFKMVVCRQWQGSDGKGHREWRFRHDKIQEFFIAQTFLGAANLRVLEHMSDPRFRGVYFLLAYLLPPEKARELRDLLVDHAAESRDHTVSDDFVKLLKAREEADKARTSLQVGGAPVIPLGQPA